MSLRFDITPHPVQKAIPVALAMLVLVAAPARAEWVEWVADASVSANYRHNMNFAPFRSNAENDYVLEGNVAFGRFFQAAEHTRIGLRGSVLGMAHERFDKLNGFIIGASVIGIHKFGLGDAPVARVHVTHEALEIRDEQRSGRRYEMGLNLSKRLTDRIDGSIGVTKSIRHGHDGTGAIMGQDNNVFDQVQTLWSVQGTYLVTERSLVSLGYGHMTGEFDSQCPLAGIGALALANPEIEAASNDTVFGGRCTYRLDGKVDVYSLDFSYFLTETTSLDFGFKFRDGRAGDLNYNSPSYRLAFSWIY